MPSPLDTDFFDLLQQLEARAGAAADKEAMSRIIRKVQDWPGAPIWRSMEEMFYSLHVSAVLEHRFFLKEQPPDIARELVNDFVRSIRALLGEAHGTRASENHEMLLGNLRCEGDAIITFNYDFVAERALAAFYGDPPRRNEPFGNWFYGFSERPTNAPKGIPTLYKLHGSLNWELAEDEHGDTQNARTEWPSAWAEFAQELDYSPKEAVGYCGDERARPPILLPYWDKRVEKGVWAKIWKAAADQLRRTDSLIVWGYSLPPSDLKARELLRLAFRPGARLTKFAVIDPSREVQDRWRSFIKAPFWRFASFAEFSHCAQSNLHPFR
ncbi:MAG: SIR2 family protein [Acidobacteria bacterium]|nr:SIR2 family protein [Acidobacteriota bacterium]